MRGADRPTPGRNFAAVPYAHACLYRELHQLSSIMLISRTRGLEDLQLALLFRAFDNEL